MRTTGWIAAGTMAAVLAGIGTRGAAADAGTPAALWKAKCASCHGPAGKGNPKMIKMLKTTAADLDLTDAATQKKSDADLTKVVTDGSPANKSMVAFGKKLAAGQIAGLVAFVRQLAAPKKA